MKHIELRKTKPYDIYQPECKSDCNDINCTNCVFDAFRSRGDDCPFRRFISAYPVKEPIKPRPVTLQVDHKCDSIDTKEYQDKSSGVYLRTGNRGLLARLGKDDHSKLLLEAISHLAKIDQNIIKLGKAEHKQTAPTMKHDKEVKEKLRDATDNFIKPKLLRKVDCILEDTDKPSNVLQDQRSAQDILNMCATLQANTMQMQVGPLQDMVNVLDLIIEITEKQDELTKTQQKQPVQGDQSNVPTWFLPSMENAVDDKYGRDYYHHCPDKDNKLVRLDLNVCGSFHYCPACLQSFVMK